MIELFSLETETVINNLEEKGKNRTEQETMTWACYLYFEPVSEGTLFMKWSETPLSNAMAVFTPGAKAKVPGYLTKNEGKRTELCRNISASRTQEYYRGYCAFIKTAYKFQSKLTNYASHGETGITTILAFLTPDDNVHQPDNEEEVDLTDYIAVAVMNKNNNMVEGVKTMSKGKFVDSITQAGYYALKFI